jgi:hypothetical protein
MWCGCSFSPRRGGSEQRFCGSGHRHEFHSAARRYVDRAVATGILTVAEIQNGPAEPCALLSGSNSASPAPGQAKDAMAPPGALLNDIIERLSEDQLNALPDCIWALMLYADDLRRDAPENG